MGGSSPCNTDAIFIVSNISFSTVMPLIFRHAFPPQEQRVDPRPHSLFVNGLAMLTFFFRRFTYHSQHPQGSWYLRCMVFPQQYRAVVHWIRGPSSVSESTQITLSSLLFELSSCAWLTRAMLLVRDVARHGIPTPFLKKNFFLFFRFSFRHASDLSPFPFSATTQVIDNHTRPRRNLTGRLYFVCKQCWIYLRHVTTLHEPCRGCAMMESIGWESWTPGRGRSAWWRHSCWMFMNFFHSIDSHWIIQRVMIFKSWPIPHKLCIVNHQGWSSLLHLFKLRRWFLCTSIQGRDVTRASHTSRL